MRRPWACRALRKGRGMSVFAKKVNAAQRQWLKRYEDLTGFEPMHQEDLDAGTMTFSEVAWRNVHWYEDHTSDMHLAIQRPIRGMGPIKPLEVRDAWRRP